MWLIWNKNEKLEDNRTDFDDNITRTEDYQTTQIQKRAKCFETKVIVKGERFCGVTTWGPFKELRGVWKDFNCRFAVSLLQKWRRSYLKNRSPSMTTFHIRGFLIRHGLARFLTSVLFINITVTRGWLLATHIFKVGFQIWSPLTY